MSGGPLRAGYSRNSAKPPAPTSKPRPHHHRQNARWVNIGGIWDRVGPFFNVQTHCPEASTLLRIEPRPVSFKKRPAMKQQCWRIPDIDELSPPPSLSPSRRTNPFQPIGFGPEARWWSDQPMSRFHRAQLDRHTFTEPAIQDLGFPHNVIIVARSASVCMRTASFPRLRASRRRVGRFVRRRSAAGPTPGESRGGVAMM
ncbi:hypothetical protein SKAU_G00229630 [Synaphobranchus kaupii]|uniref:Uncharacterized protein n=1 Tax=Synaphobranchus kaupii TaxID=118154 RepID=A0A9Q1F5C0_SYNKA|nr:hypothetical protein SKAU_G00229630 [Synaphobranchus kaupii]